MNAREVAEISHGRKRHRRVGWVAAGALCVLALVSCSGDGKKRADATPEPAASRSKAPAPAPSSQAPSQREWLACTDPSTYVYNLTSTQYAGAGPHPITAIAVPVDTSQQPTPDYVEPGGFHLPEGWEPLRGSDALAPVDRSRVQLVACVAGAIEPTPHSPPSGTIKCLQFEDKKPFVTAIYEASYKVTVLEARSSRVVTTFTVEADGSDQQSCPSLALAGGVLRRMDVLEFHAELAPFFAGTG